ncbi:L-type lectin family protein [Lacticaseibacillus songhuajiangensis]|jgi:hypothetical protein|uniref:lectin-like domain-containing protein n=1 Tax=Lacticaseibacillus songhuajiangensis TaxID=1296539 RepID=UPI000F792051|nr:hypothetical protein [Lacticaseibacillus songhuajiangensis]
MKMTNLKKRMLKASVTLGLVFGAALFAVQAVHSVESNAADDLSSLIGYSWTDGNNPYPEPAKDDDGSDGYTPFAADSVSISAMMGIKTDRAHVIPTKDSNYGLAVQVNGKPSGSNSFGSFYANQPLDLTKKFEQSAMVYLGDSSVTPGDGMSFVLTTESSAFTSNYGGAGSNGVWGYPQDQGSIPGGASTGMQHSFVITMDTHADTDTFDKNVDYGSSSSKQYVGYGYPGLPAMYTGIASGSSKKYVLNWGDTGDSEFITGGNYTPVDGTLNTGGWHILTVNWTPDGDGGGTLDYSLKIRDASGVVKQTIQRSIAWNKYAVEAIFGSTTAKLYWGYAGADYSGNEPHVVAFNKLGDTAASVSATGETADSSAITSDTKVKVGDQLIQKYTIGYSSIGSNTPWPASGDLNAVLKTNANYKFVTNADGKVPVTVFGKSYEAELVDDQTAKLTIPAITSDIQDDATVQVEAVGTDSSLTNSFDAITIGGGTTIRSANMSLPVPEVSNKTTTILIPSFTFGSYGITQFMTGFTDEGTATTSKDNQLAVTTDGNTSNVRMTVALNPVDDLAPDYNGGKVHLKFDFGGNNVDLTDDGTEKQLFSESTIPDTSVGKTPVLTVGKVPNVTTGAKNASLTWTVAVTPPVTAAAN